MGLSPSKSADATRPSRGFTLIELMIVIAIIAIIAAIAIPNLLESRKSANESSAINYMRTWVTAQEMYREKHGYYADADNQLVQEGFIGADRGDGIGYHFSIDNEAGSRWEWWGRGNPVRPGVTGDRYFYIHTDGIIRFATNGSATRNHPPIGR
jgi:prepilin-type N-terminal cleavage/methylation domain-containing protein